MPQNKRIYKGHMLRAWYEEACKAMRITYIHQTINFIAALKCTNHTSYLIACQCKWGWIIDISKYLPTLQKLLAFLFFNFSPILIDCSWRLFISELIDPRSASMYQKTKSLKSYKQTLIEYQNRTVIHSRHK
jgi:hypothetical protein